MCVWGGGGVAVGGGGGLNVRLCRHNTVANDQTHAS